MEGWEREWGGSDVRTDVFLRCSCSGVMDGWMVDGWMDGWMGRWVRADWAASRSMRCCDGTMDNGNRTRWIVLIPARACESGATTK